MQFCLGSQAHPHSHEIIDQDFPLRYITVNNTRVAVTVIDLWELAGVLVCVTNTDEHRHVFEWAMSNLQSKKNIHALPIITDSPKSRWSIIASLTA
ncbi:MAG: hypothetical protein IPJ49_30770 [Candidatus Obscuribacter sp.]|nr:hypothetical protein [Candidatus Obscuribacter sp.]